MGRLRRLCMIVFVISAILGIGVLATVWFEWAPLLPFVEWLADMPWFYTAESILLGITALGVLIVLIRALTAPGKRSQLEIQRDGGNIAITQAAIQSTVRHVIAAHQGLTPDTIKISIAHKQDPRMSVRAKVDPGRHANLGELGALLQREIAASLEAFTGAPVDSVHITFSGEAEAVTPGFTQQAVEQSMPAPPQQDVQPRPTPTGTAQ